MDIFAHTLWAAAVFQRLPLRPRWWGAFFGVAPDLASFGIFFVQRLWLGFFQVGKPPLELIPGYVYVMYDLTHSLVVFAGAVLLVYLARGYRLWWPMFGWGLHIGIDIFTHGREFFPTPFLWPLSPFTVNSFSWAEPWFMAVNYGALALTYVAWYLHDRRRRAARP